jgi:hypothetical protein
VSVVVVVVVVVVQRLSCGVCASRQCGQAHRRQSTAGDR